MTSPDDWKEIAKWLWAILLLPVGVVWKKVDGAVQKDDFNDSIKEVSGVIKAHADHDEKMQERTRESLIDIFEKLEKQGRGIERIETTLTFLRERK